MVLLRLQLDRLRKVWTANKRGRGIPLLLRNPAQWGGRIGGRSGSRQLSAGVYPLCHSASGLLRGYWTAIYAQ